LESLPSVSLRNLFKKEIEVLLKRNPFVISPDRAASNAQDLVLRCIPWSAFSKPCKGEIECKVAENITLDAKYKYYSTAMEAFLCL